MIETGTLNQTEFAAHRKREIDLSEFIEYEKRYEIFVIKKKY